MTESEKLRNELSKALLLAAMDNNFEKVKDILNCEGIDINFKGQFGYSALHWAAIYGFEELAEFLILRGAEINIISSLSLITPLILAAMNGRSNITALLINNHADVNLKKYDGNTALHHAPPESLDTIETLLNAKADVHSTNSAGQLPLAKISASIPSSAPAGLLNSIQDLFNKYHPPSKMRP